MGTILGTIQFFREFLLDKTVPKCYYISKIARLRRTRPFLVFYKVLPRVLFLGLALSNLDKASPHPSHSDFRQKISGQRVL